MCNYIYRKIPKISPRAYIFQRPLLRGLFLEGLMVARYSFSGSIPPKFERKLRRHKQRFGKINTTVVLDKDENLL